MSESLAPVMVRAGCGPLTATSEVGREDVIHRQRRPEKVAVCGSSPSAGDELVLATARWRCPPKRVERAPLGGSVGWPARRIRFTPGGRRGRGRGHAGGGHAPQRTTAYHLNF